MDAFPADMVLETKAIGPAGTLMEGEFWVVCPFNKHHKALNHQYGKHLGKCRRNHMEQLIASKDPWDLVTCKYDPEHLVFAPELLLHEHTCPSKMEKLLVNNVWTAIYDEVAIGLESSVRKLAIYYQREENQYLSAAKTKTKALGCDLDTVVNEVHRILMEIFYKESDGLMGSFKLEEAIETSELQHNTGLSVEEECFEDELDVSYIARRRRVERSIQEVVSRKVAISKMYVLEREKPIEKLATIEPKDEKLKKVVEEDDDADWSDGTNPTFNWCQWQHQVSPMTCVVPPGLSKAQRKLHIKQNKDKLKYEYGYFHAGKDEGVYFPSVVQVSLQDF